MGLQGDFAISKKIAFLFCCRVPRKLDCNSRYGESEMPAKICCSYEFNDLALKMSAVVCCYDLSN